MMIDTIEDRDVAGTDVVGAYLNANMKAFVVLKVVTKEVNIMCKVITKFKEYIINQKWEKNNIYY